MLEQRLVEQVAAALQTTPGLVEKDWQVTRAIGVLAGLDHGAATPAFGGGTSLSKAWGLIKRFSEDIDFKVAMPPGLSRNKARDERGAYRERVLSALTAAGFTLDTAPRKRDENRFFSADLFYPGLFDPGQGLRPHIRVEMSLVAPALPSIDRPIGSLMTAVQGQPPEVATFPCVDPVETAADKLSALAWRVWARRRESPNDDPRIVRHLHDLAALKAAAVASAQFVPLVLQARAADEGRGGETSASSSPALLFAGMLERLNTDPLWAAEYEQFVNLTSFARPDEQIDFADALAAVRELVALFQTVEFD